MVGAFILKAGRVSLILSWVIPKTLKTVSVAAFANRLANKSSTEVEMHSEPNKSVNNNTFIRGATKPQKLKSTIKPHISLSKPILNNSGTRAHNVK